MPVFSGKDEDWPASFTNLTGSPSVRVGVVERLEVSLSIASPAKLLEYTVKLQLEDYDELKRELKRRFEVKDAPPVARRKLHVTLQKEDEKLVDFSQGVYFLA
jgi:hypothetical protein